MNETEQSNSTTLAPSASETPMTAQEWTAIRFPAMEFTTPDKAEFLADAEKHAAMLPVLRAVLTRDDQVLETAARAAPRKHLELLEWFDGTATDYEKNAAMMRRAAYGLGLVLTRLELEVAQ